MRPQTLLLVLPWLALGQHAGGLCPQEDGSSETVLRLLRALPDDDRLRVVREATGGAGTAPEQDVEAPSHSDIGWIELAVLSVGVTLLAYITGLVLLEARRYKSIPCCQGEQNKKSIQHHFKYRFGLWYSKTQGASSIVLLCLSVVLHIVGGVLHSTLTGSPIAGSLWAAWIWIAAPDGGGSAEGYGRIAGALVSCGGMLIFALLMSVVSSSFEEMLDMFKHRGYPLVEGGHIVILGWSSMVPSLVEELCTAMEGSGGTVIAILTPLEKVEVEEMLEDAGVDFKNSDVAVRKGDRRIVQDLDSVSVQTASIVIVASRDDVSREDSDARQLNVLSAMNTAKYPSNGLVLVQCMLPNNSDFLMGFCQSKQKAAIITGDILGAFMVHGLQQHGLGQATCEMLGFDGDEIYISHVEGIAGRNFQEVIFGLPGAVAMGIARGGTVELLPDMDMTLQGDDRIIMLAEDRSKCPTKLDDKRIEDVSAILRPNNTKYVKCALLQQEASQKCETVLIIGWNEAIGAVLCELDKVLALGSTVVVFSPAQIADCEAFVQAALERRGKKAFSNLSVEHRSGPLCARTHLAALPIREANKILILADNSAAKPRDVDGATLAVALQVMDIRRAHQQNTESTAESPVVVPQILQSSMEEHFQQNGLPDYILSEKLVASICAQVACDPVVGGIIPELLSEHGCGLRVRTISEYPQLPGQHDESESTFANIAARAARAGEVALGYKKSACEPWTLNPKRWLDVLKLTPDSRIVSLIRPRQATTDGDFVPASSRSGFVRTNDASVQRAMDVMQDVLATVRKRNQAARDLHTRNSEEAQPGSTPSTRKALGVMQGVLATVRKRNQTARSSDEAQPDVT